MIYQQSTWKRKVSLEWFRGVGCRKLRGDGERDPGFLTLSDFECKDNLEGDPKKIRKWNRRVCHWHVSFLSDYLFSGRKWANRPMRTTSLEKNPQTKCFQRRAVRLDRSNWYSTRISWFRVICWSSSRERLRWLWTSRQVRHQDFTRENFAPQP